MSNSLNFVGRIAKAPLLTRPNGHSICKFTLIRNEYTGKDDAGEKRDERIVALPLVAFGGQAEAIAQHSMEGDQLIVDARIENNVYEVAGEKRYDYNFVVTGFEFGAPGRLKRAQLDSQRAGA